ncbi:MAG: DNA polymerase III subunit gamma/tau [Ruminococcaceae bacterium]|nr:DNA polymerase III subunit gamma/tau [Oscillospiraceae bacterium]
MHQALYRKYRPQSFDDVCGQEQVTSVLRYEAEHGKVSHAYLFCGPRGTGKTTCAKILAKAVNCLSPVNGSPCGKCFACQSIDEGSAVDVLEMDAASNNGVDYIRDIREAVNYTPNALNKRVYIIDEVHMLSTSAFNALLKTLEEPPEHVLFILATTELHKLPATIISRCQRMDFRRMKVDVLASRLVHIAELEGITLEENAAKIISKQAMGGMRDAISLFELCASGGHDVTSERVTEILGLSGTEISYKAAVAVKRRDTAAIFNIVRTVASSSKDIAVFWQELLEFWRDMLVCKYLPSGELTDYLDLTEPELRVLEDAARRFDQATLTYHFSILDDAMREMTRSPQTKRLTAELSLMKMCDPSLEATVEALTARVTELENKLALLRSGGSCGGAVQTDEPTAEPEPLVFEEKKVTAEPDSSDIPHEEKGEHEVKSAHGAAEKAEPTRIRDVGEIAEKVASANPMYMSFFRDADCYVSPDRKEVTVKTTSSFAVQMLSSDSAKKVLLSAFVLCDVCDSDAVLVITAGAEPKAKSPVDELTEF